MIDATARVVQNIIEIRVGAELWTCKPQTTATGALTRRIAALFSTEYLTYRSSEPGEVHSTVSYHPKRDEIIIQSGEERWRTQSTPFGPITFDYGGVHYSIFEKLTGRFGILEGTKIVAEGELGFRSCKIRQYPPGLETFLADLALGYLIRTLFWEMLR